MKIKDLLYQTPEMTEERLFTFIKQNWRKNKTIENRLYEIHKSYDCIENLILKEWDLIQEKKSYLSKMQRDIISGVVSLSLIQMTKTNETTKEQEV